MEAKANFLNNSHNVAESIDLVCQSYLSPTLWTQELSKCKAFFHHSVKNTQVGELIQLTNLVLKNARMGTFFITTERNPSLEDYPFQKGSIVRIEHANIGFPFAYSPNGFLAHLVIYVVVDLTGVCEKCGHRDHICLVQCPWCGNNNRVNGSKVYTSSLGPFSVGFLFPTCQPNLLLEAARLASPSCPMSLSSSNCSTRSVDLPKPARRDECDHLAVGTRENGRVESPVGHSVCSSSRGNLGDVYKGRAVCDFGSVD